MNTSATTYRYPAGAPLPSPERLGGKGANLAALQHAGQPVPDWYGIPTEAFRNAVHHHGLQTRIRESVASLSAGDEAGVKAAAATIQGWIRELPAVADLPPMDGYVAVRSSAVDEDAAGGSFAGLHDSFLFLRGDDAVRHAIRQVWASAYNERALTYRLSRGLRLDDIGIAVIVQEMVHARVSGVMFTAHPTSGNVHEVVISSLYGAGEGIVSAGLDADTYCVSKTDFSVDARLAEKPTQLLLDPEHGGLRLEPVPESERKAGSLTPDQVRAVARAGLTIERYFRKPQDIEFSLDGDGNLFILQARPVTTVAEYGPAAGHRQVWDNSNIIESYSGVTSPMTFSFIRRAYTIVYHCFTSVMGISPRVVEANRHTLENMLGLFRGEVYYNLFNWYRLVRLFPGYNYNKGFMESMMGVKEPAELADAHPPSSRLRRTFVDLPALLRLLLRSSWNFLRIRRLTAQFQAEFNRHYTVWAAMDFDVMDPHRLAATYREMEDKLLRNWKAPIINDFFVMIFYGALRKLCAAWCGDAGGSLQNDLLCGEGDIESTVPTRKLMQLARTAAADPVLSAWIRDESPEVLAEQLPGDPRFTAFAGEIEEYLDRYGFRCINELKLEEPSLRDRPAFLYQILRNYLALDPAALDIAAMEEREQAIRARAEASVSEALGPLRGCLFRGVLRCARLGVKNRENMRFARTRIYGLLRELLRAQGRHLVREDILDHPDDIFYLTIDEVWDFIHGTAVTTRLRALAGLRKTEFATYRDHPDRAPHDRFETYGMAYHRNRFQAVVAEGPVLEDGMLKGTGCCPGKLTRPVKVLRSPADDMQLDGEILVAGRTDPGWVPLYPSVSGLLIERGSILSHSAIVAREMGIPTIVGIPGLLATLRTGHLVTMDGAAGTVRLESGE